MVFKRGEIVTPKPRYEEHFKTLRITKDEYYLVRDTFFPYPFGQRIKIVNNQGEEKIYQSEWFKKRSLVFRILSIVPQTLLKKAVTF